MELRRGGRIGDYDLLDEIGRGGMAQVWSVQDVRGNTYAVKTLLPEFASDAALQERLLREARNQCQLQHPAIVRAYGTFQSEGRTFILMELVNGESLEAYLARRRPLPMPEVRGIARSVLSGLGYAHSMRLVHRDLKPSNILLSNTGAIQIADFGIALLLGQKRLTKFGAMGTPSYMSPEQIRTPLSIDERSDIYSFACVLYELVAGYPPFHFESGENDYLVREAHLTRKPQPLTSYRPETPAAIDAAILRALEKDPVARFATCDEFAAALGLQIDTGFQAPTPRSRVVQAQWFRATPSGPAAPPRAADPKSGTPRPATPSGQRPPAPSGPRQVTPSGNRGATPSGQPGPATPKPATPPAPKSATPRPGQMTGVSRARPTPGASPPTPPAFWRGLTRDKQKSVGIAAISVAAALLLAAGILLISHRQPGPPSPAPSPEAAQTVEPPVPPPEKTKRPVDQSQPAAPRPADGDTAGQRSEPPAIAPLRKLFEDSRAPVPEPASAETESPAAVSRPHPLGPAPTIGSGRSSGVLQWSGAAPAAGGPVTIFDGTQLGGSLSGDALPGVPVNISVDSPDVRVIEPPGPANSYHRVVMQVPANWTKPIRISWREQKGVLP